MISVFTDSNPVGQCADLTDSRRVDIERRRHQGLPACEDEVAGTDVRCPPGILQHSGSPSRTGIEEPNVTRKAVRAMRLQVEEHPMVADDGIAG